MWEDGRVLAEETNTQQSEVVLLDVGGKNSPSLRRPVAT
jgi:hypothetical protein